MATTNKENQRIVERFLSYMAAKKLTKVEVEAQLGVGKGYLNKQISRDGSLGADLIVKILNKYPDIDLYWLLKGGITGDNNNIQSGIVGNTLGDNSQIQYGLCQKEVENLKKIIEEKDKQNDLLKEYLADVKTSNTDLRETVAQQKETIAQLRDQLRAQ